MLNREQYLLVSNIIDQFWLFQNQIKEEVEKIWFPKNEDEKVWVNQLVNIIFCNKPALIGGGISDENLTSWKGAFERINQKKEVLQVENLCCYHRGHIYSFVSSEKAKKMAKNDAGSLMLMGIEIPFIKLKFTQLTRETCGLCQELIVELEKERKLWLNYLSR